MPQSKWKRILLGLAALLAAAAVWFSIARFFYTPDIDTFFQPQGLAPRARQLAARHVRMWTEPALLEREIARMRGSNAEWDFMGRTFLAWALANMTLRDPDNSHAYLAIVDRILEETIRLEKENGHLYFLMDYARGRDFAIKPNRSLFIDGEIALTYAMRRLASEKPEYKAPMRERIDIMLERMRQSPVLSGESYPMECWMFCNTVALAAIRAGDALDGTDHSAFLEEWLAKARANLVDKKTGLLISSYQPSGAHYDGPEGSSIWMAAHCLDIIDAPFARDQYERARRELAVNLMGFGYAREWPESWHGPQDIDSGPIVPVLEASAGSSGQAFLGAATFGDQEYLERLLASLQFAAFPIRERDTLRYAASNQVGDAVLLYAMVAGPIWDKIKRSRKENPQP